MPLSHANSTPELHKSARRLSDIVAEVAAAAATRFYFNALILLSFMRERESSQCVRRCRVLDICIVYVCVCSCTIPRFLALFTFPSPSHPSFLFPLKDHSYLKLYPLCPRGFTDSLLHRHLSFTLLKVYRTLAELKTTSQQHAHTQSSLWLSE